MSDTSIQWRKLIFLRFKLFTAESNFVNMHGTRYFCEKENFKKTSSESKNKKPINVSDECVKNIVATFKCG